jgi:hypothetical protein
MSIIIPNPDWGTIGTPKGNEDLEEYEIEEEEYE